MALNTVWLKAHWYYVAAGVLGLVILYEIIKSMGSSSSAASPTDLSGGATQLQSLSAAADLQNAQVNGQVAVAQYGAEVADNQTAAAAQVAEVKTAAELEATNNQTAASVETAAIDTQGAVDTASIVTNGAVAQTQIEADTIDTLSNNKTAVQLTGLEDVNSQIQHIQTYSKNAAKDYAAITPVLAEETGQGSTVGMAKPTPGSTTAQNISAASTGIGSILSGLFGG